MPRGGGGVGGERSKTENSAKKEYPFSTFMPLESSYLLLCSENGRVKSAGVALNWGLTVLAIPGHSQTKRTKIQTQHQTQRFIKVCKHSEADN